MSASESTDVPRATGAGGEPAAPSRRARLRGAVIAYFVLFNALAALPTPGEPSAERLQRPFEQGELRRWTRLFHAVGIDTDPDRLALGYLAFARGVERARAIVLAPIEGWFELTQSGQNWHLFGTPDRVISALRITAHSATGDEVLYESGDPAHRWHADFLEYRRIRAAYKPSRRGPPATYFALAERLSRQVFAERPEVERVTVAFVERRVQLPGAANRGGDEPRIADQLVFEKPRA
ncbi:MAG TPA: hypothetical protein VMG12_23050 [Polyangiaceae bacterium]|nr:hypothetical protein [Polyangiaceae bacterium]